MPLDISKFSKLQEYKEKRKVSIIMICRCGARNLSDSERCWKCKRPMTPQHCKILANWNTRKGGRCKRFFICNFADDPQCVATGG